MNKFLVVIFISTTITYSALSESDLKAQNAQQEHLNPLNDNENSDNSSNIQDKRTILNPVSNVGWAKHVGISKSGNKFVLGYSPVDLKLTPVIRPIGIKHTGYRYGKPNIHFHIKSPAVLKPRPFIGSGWKPIVTIPKPVVQVAKPGHVDVVHHQPSPHIDHVNTHPDPHVYGVPAHVDNTHQVQHIDHVHVDHVHQVPGHIDHVHRVPGHIDHVHQVPGHIDHVHQVPGHIDHVHQVPGHIDHVHQVSVAHGDHIDTASHVDHLHPVHFHPTQAAVPVPVPSLRPIQPFLPSPVLFEVTKPNLGVLPLGATFPHPVLPDVRHVHFRPAAVPQPLLPVAQPQPIFPVAQPLPPAVPVAPLPQPVFPQLPPPHLHPIHVPGVALPAPEPLPHPAVHLPHPYIPGSFPLGPRPAAVQPQYPPGTVVEYHGTHNFVPFNGLQPLLPQTPVNAVQPLLPPHVHLDNGLQPLVPQTPLNAVQPHLHFSNGLQPQLQPHLHFNSITGVRGETEAQPQYQQLPVESASPNFLQQPLPSSDEAHFQNQQQQHQQYLPQEVTNIQHYDGATSSAVIQPGQSDLQVPYHLPQHNFVPDGRSFQPGNWHDPSQYPDNAASETFRPSIQLEAPFSKK